MYRRVSRAQIETQGRGEALTESKKQGLSESRETRAFAEAYQTILARELFINDPQEENTKFF